MGLRAAAIGIALALLPVAAARANNSVAEAAAGGLVLVQTADIEMRSEDLRISRDSVTVHYQFFNRTDRDITTTVAFPLPEIVMGQGIPYAMPEGLPPDNFVGFSVAVDGRPVPVRLEERAILRDGRDVAPVLKAHGIPLTNLVPPSARMREPVQQAIAALSAATRARLVADGILGPGEAGDEDAQWTAKSLFAWEQTFPARRTVAVSDRYYPVLGTTWISEMTVRDRPDPDSYWPRYCPTAALRADLLAKLATRPKDFPYLHGYLLDYVLTTGANWAGPIGHFKLTIETPDADTALASCFDGLMRTGPTTWTLERRDFRPDADLRVIFIQDFAKLGPERAGRIAPPH